MRGGAWGGCVVLTGIVLFLGVWLWLYSYHDCLRVGHTKTYCILNH